MDEEDKDTEVEHSGSKSILGDFDPTDNIKNVANQVTNVTLKNILKQTIIAAGFEKEIVKTKEFLIQELPNRIGNKIKILLGRVVDENNPIDHQELLLVAEEIAEEAVTTAPQAVSLVLMSIGRTQTPAQAMKEKLAIYENFIHKIAGIVIKRQRSLMLKGFFHSEQGYSLWHYHNPRYEDNSVENLTDLSYVGLNISTDHPVEIIYLNKPDTTEEKVESTLINWEPEITRLNGRIRNLEVGKPVISKNADIRKTDQARNVVRFDEFYFESINVDRKTLKTPIPPELPGLTTLLASVPVAIRAQDEIDATFAAKANDEEQKFKEFFK
jgi:hypothetical protein